MELEWDMTALRRELKRAKKMAKGENNDYMTTLLSAMNDKKLTRAEGDLIHSYIIETETRWEAAKRAGLIPATNEISTFFHCRQCMLEKPDEVSPREWAQIEAGFTKLGVQVWCKRHEINIVHIDFGGQRHHANTSIVLPT